MNSYFYKTITLLVILTASFTATAQKKSETKAYKAAVKTQTIAAYDRFLDKYPKSVYKPQLIRLKDSIITVMNTTPYTAEQAIPLFSDASGIQPENFQVLPYRKDGTDYLYAVVKEGDGRSPISFQTFSLQEGAWNKTGVKEFPRYIVSDKINGYHLTDTISFMDISKEKYIRFCYENTSDGRNREFVANLIKLSDFTINSAMFSGKLLQKDPDAAPAGSESIEGTADMITNDSLTPIEMRLLVGYLATRSQLIPMSEADAQTDESVDWWYDNNKKGASSLSFGIVPQTSSMVIKYKASKDKEHSKSYDAAVIDIRENTVVCAYRKSTKQYILVWCEPVTVDIKHDLYLSNIYFENDNVLVLYYYKGNTTSKVRINLANKTIKR